MTEKKSELNGMMVKMDKFFHEYLAVRAPAIPEDVKELIVKYGPWISLVLGLLALPALLTLLGLGAVLTPAAALMGGFNWGILTMVNMILMIAGLVLSFAAIPKLMKRELGGWRLAYYSILVGAVNSLVSMSVFGLIIGTGVGLYILYQVKDKYK